MSKLTDLQDRADDLELELSEIKEAMQVEASRLAKTVTVNRRKATTVLTSEDGRQIVVDNKRNTFDETNIYKYNGKKGKLIIGGVRGSLHRIKIYLAEGIY